MIGEEKRKPVDYYIRLKRASTTTIFIQTTKHQHVRGMHASCEMKVEQN